MPAPPLTSRVEVRLGLAFWIAAGTTAAVHGVFATWLPFAVPVVALVALWPYVRRAPTANVVLDWLPLAFVVLTYEMLHTLIPACALPTIDGPLAAMDRAVLGEHAAVLLEPFASRALTTVMAVFYGGYFPLTTGMAFWLYLRRSRTAFREYCVGEIGGLFIGYVGYLYLPAIGPHAWLPVATWREAPLDGDFIDGINRSLNANHGGLFARDAFPSMHTANAVTILLVAWRHDRRAFNLLLVPCLGLIAATVYLRLHWVVDVIAGAALALAWQPVARRLVAREATEPST